MCHSGYEVGSRFYLKKGEVKDNQLSKKVKGGTKRGNRWKDDLVYVYDHEDSKVGQLRLNLTSAINGRRAIKTRNLATLLKKEFIYCELRLI